MNKGDFLKVMGEKAGLNGAQTKKAYDAFVETLVSAMKKGEKVQLIGFATFELKSRAARTGINPMTKQKIKIAASKVPAAKFGAGFKSLFN
ncbi:MAG: HU family DNA-binding protein [Clostridia bacterium]|nr:HU family DNA-binding protein [Clostridia bacterium]